MTDKFEIYDILSVLVPGSLLVGLLPLCFPAVLGVREAKFPDTFAVLLLTALAVFLGFVVQAIASLLEPVLERTWGGRPSRRVFSDGLGRRYLGKDEAERIKEKLLQAISEGQSDTALFRYASQISDAAGVGRCARFNGLYAYHRSLLVTALIAVAAFLMSILWGAAASLHFFRIVSILLSAILLLALLWHRAKQRSLYFAAEILMTAERVLDERAQKK